MTFRILYCIIAVGLTVVALWRLAMFMQAYGRTVRNIVHASLILEVLANIGTLCSRLMDTNITHTVRAIYFGLGPDWSTPVLSTNVHIIFLGITPFLSFSTTILVTWFVYHSLSSTHPVDQVLACGISQYQYECPHLA